MTSNHHHHHHLNPRSTSSVHFATVWERYVVALSKSSRAKCRGCGREIDRDALRVEYLKKMSDSSWRGCKYHFNDCFVNSSRKTPKLKEAYRPGDALVVIEEAGMTSEEIAEVKDFFASSHPGESVGAYKWRQLRKTLSSSCSGSG